MSLSICSHEPQKQLSILLVSKWEFKVRLNCSETRKKKRKKTKKRKEKKHV